MERTLFDPPEDDAELAGWRAAQPELPPTTIEDHGGTLEHQFAAFHAANPWVYDALRDMALELVHAGHPRVGIGMLFEVLRWRYMRSTVGSDFKLNNNWRSRYARLLAASEPELAEAFELRTLRTP